MNGLAWCVLDGVRAVPAAEWDALVDASDPFMEHAFLATLEASGSVGPDAGCTPRFIAARRDGRLVGAFPLYLKVHSYGEFIFDWAWASGAARAGIDYYPKLVAAVPYTPATGRRLLVHPEDPAPSEIEAGLVARADEEAQRLGASSVHVLFCTEAETRGLAPHGYAPRLSMQFHWTNRPERPYRDFDDYLSEFRSPNRKQVRKERAVAAGHGLRLATKTGAELDDRDWAALHQFYLSNAEKHDSITYLRPRFFELARTTLAHRIVATLAYRGDTPIAGALNFERGKHIYGRYWGCLEEHAMLHFELCYYRLIDRAIAHGCTRFEAGAQGEHKLKRGLVPSFTHSAHRIFHPGLAAAIARFVASEAEAVAEQAAEYTAHTPFHRATPDEASRA